MGQFRSYLAHIWRDCQGQLPAAIGLVIAGALLEGIGLFAILPFAAVITGSADTEAGKAAIDFLTVAGLTTDLSRALALSGAFLGVLALRNWVIWLRDIRLQALGLGYVDRWRARLFNSVSRADWLTVSALRRTDIEHALTIDVSRLTAGTAQLLRSTAASAIAVVQLLIIAVLSPSLLLLVLTLFAAAMIVTLPLLRRAYALGKHLTAQSRDIHTVLGDFMASQKLARINNAQHAFTQHYQRILGNVRDNQISFISAQSAAKGWFQMAAGVVVLAALLIGLFVLKTPLSVLAITLLVLARLAGPVQMIAATGQSIANTLPAFTSLQQLQAGLTSAKPEEPAFTHAAAISSPNHAGPASFTLSKASFAFPGSTSAILDQISIVMGPSECVAISGPSGSGKTTLLDMITGLIIPTQGALLIDGELVQDAQSLRRWRDQIAYLPQDPFLFGGTIYDNLIWSAPGASDADIETALDIAELSALSADGKLGLTRPVGERGSALSGGERQRICIARALLRKPRLLILDEATNALDKQREEQILSRLTAMRSNFSILLVTHRTETLKFADRVVYLGDNQEAAQ